jgi:hypothetical protein
MRVVSILLVLSTTGTASPYPAAECARRTDRRQDFAAAVDSFQKCIARANPTPLMRIAFYHHAANGRARAGVLFMGATCASDLEFTNLIRRVRDANPSLKIPAPPPNPPVLAVNRQDLSLAAFLENR